MNLSYDSHLVKHGSNSGVEFNINDRRIHNLWLVLTAGGESEQVYAISLTDGSDGDRFVRYLRRHWWTISACTICHNVDLDGGITTDRHHKDVRDIITLTRRRMILLRGENKGLKTLPNGFQSTCWEPGVANEGSDVRRRGGRERRGEADERGSSPTCR